MTLSAVPMAKTARTMNRTFSISLSQPLRAELWVVRRPEQHHRRRDDDVDDRGGQQELPAEAHQLVIAKTRQREAYPHRQDDQCQHLHCEVDKAEPGIKVHLWPDVTAEKQRH